MKQKKRLELWRYRGDEIPKDLLQWEKLLEDAWTFVKDPFVCHQLNIEIDRGYEAGDEEVVLVLSCEGAVSSQKQYEDLTNVIKKMSPDQFVASLVKAGIVDEDGKLTEPYRNRT